MDSLAEQGFQFAAEEPDFIAAMEQAEREEEEERMLDAIDWEKDKKETEALFRKEKRFIKKILTPRQFEAFYAYEYVFLKKCEIAEKMKITEGAVRKLLIKARKP